LLTLHQRPSCILCSEINLRALARLRASGLWLQLEVFWMTIVRLRVIVAIPLIVFQVVLLNRSGMQ
jgi:hypothetical protein